MKTARVCLQMRGETPPLRAKVRTLFHSQARKDLLLHLNTYARSGQNFKWPSEADRAGHHQLHYEHAFENHKFKMMISCLTQELNRLLLLSIPLIVKGAVAIPSINVALQASFPAPPYLLELLYVLQLVNEIKRAI